MAATSPTRMATPADHGTVLDVFVESFVADPFWHYFMPDPEREGFARSDAIRSCFDAEISGYIASGHTHVIDDRAAAMWSPPGIHANDEGFMTAFGEHGDPALMEASFGCFVEVGGFRPEVPYFYLHMIGATDAARGQGLGSVLIRRVTEICDAEGWPAFLEASTPRSAALYERHGFQELAVIEFAPGVALRPMLRPPA